MTSIPVPCRFALLLMAAALLPLGAEEEVPFGAAIFYPSAMHPVGWCGDGSAMFPGATPPLAWDEPSGTNILWKTELPNHAYGAAPVVVGDKVYICSEPDILNCLAAEDGRLLWSIHVNAWLHDKPAAEQARWHAAWGYDQPIAKALKEQGQRNDKDNGQSKHIREALWNGDLEGTRGLLKMGLSPLWVGFTYPTPVSDGEHIYIKNALGTVGCVTLDGKVRWIKGYRIKSGNTFVELASPWIVGDVLLLNFNGHFEAWDKHTGERLWRVESDAEKVREGDLSQYLGDEELVSPILGKRLRDWGGNPGKNHPLLPFWHEEEPYLVDNCGRIIRIRDGKFMPAFQMTVPPDDSSGPYPSPDGEFVIWNGFSRPKKAWTVGRLVPHGEDGVRGEILWSKLVDPSSGGGYSLHGVVYEGHIFSPGGDKGLVCIRLADGALVDNFRTYHNDWIEQAREEGRYPYGEVSFSKGVFRWVSLGGDKLFYPSSYCSYSVHQLGPNGTIVKGAERYEHLNLIDHELDRMPEGIRTDGRLSCHISPFFQGDRIYMRTAKSLVCVGASERFVSTGRNVPEQ